MDDEGWHPLRAGRSCDNDRATQPKSGLELYRAARIAVRTPLLRPKEEQRRLRRSTVGQVQLSINLWYDTSTKRVPVTSNDPDLPREGLCTNLKPGTQIEVPAPCSASSASRRRRRAPSSAALDGRPTPPLGWGARPMGHLDHDARCARSWADPA
jgi:hypothetical protein